MIRDFDAAVQQAYAGGQTEALARIAAPALVDEIARELSDPTLAAASDGLAMADFGLLQVEPDANGGWQVVTDETWQSKAQGGRVRRSRLRFRYRVAPGNAGWRVEEMTPILPEAERAPRR